MMVRNRTSLTKSTRVSARPELTATLVRLILSVNDIALAADANDQSKADGASAHVTARDGPRAFPHA
jgi:hypothetical protein